ncbi:hypothetical protein [Stappia indica]|uniref:hypothetical protein n=1 Tax=Stappia indica TaxID=538381 RepID=UPI00114118A8|nr:hypothetical protein [Stappia indica]
MQFHDDASAETVAAKTISLLTSAAEQIGKADRGYSDEKLTKIREAAERLISTLDRKRSLGKGL